MPMDEMIQLIDSVLNAGSSFKLLVTGDSMRPFLRHLRDSVALVKPDIKKTRRGAIILIKRSGSGEYVLHRAYKIKKGDHIVLNGDAQQWTEDINNNQIVAVVSNIYRNNRIIECDSILYRICVFIWMTIKPFRYFLFRLYGFLRRTIFKPVSE